MAAKKAKARRKAATHPTTTPSSPLPHNFTTTLAKYLSRHHALYDSAAKAEQLEELVSKALTDSNEPNTWHHGSHRVSVDITLNKTQKTLSVKSGTLTHSQSVLNVSGSRLGAHKLSVAEMLTHLKTTSADYYLCVSRAESEWKNVTAQSEKKYHLFVFPATMLNYGTATQWTKTINKKGFAKYHYRPDSGTLKKADITESMSHQLWNYIHVNQLPPHETITIPGQP